MPTKPALPPDVRRLRARVDRLNTRLVALLQQRARLARRLAVAKARHGLAASDPARERAMLRTMLEAAPPGFARRELAGVLRSLLAASRRLVVAEQARAAARLRRSRPRARG
ncbi:MAG: chorismate mutase [Planctomycetia bacterium]